MQALGLDDLQASSTTLAGSESGALGGSSARRLTPEYVGLGASETTCC